MSSAADLGEVIAVIADALASVEGDLDTLDEMPREMWPREIITSMEERMALAATMKRAVELMPERAEELRTLYKVELQRAHWETALRIPVLDDTQRELADAREYLRRQAILDPRLERALLGSETIAANACGWTTPLVR